MVELTRANANRLIAYLRERWPEEACDDAEAATK
jgi:hypothetical protein